MAKEIDFDELDKKIDQIKKDWPYDTSKPLTDAQLKEQGANDVTDDNKGLGITISKGPSEGK